MVYHVIGNAHMVTAPHDDATAREAIRLQKPIGQGLIVRDPEDATRALHLKARDLDAVHVDTNDAT